MQRTKLDYVVKGLQVSDTIIVIFAAAFQRSTMYVCMRMVVAHQSASGCDCH